MVPPPLVRKMEMQNAQKKVRDYIPNTPERTLLNKRLYAEDADQNAKASTRLYFIQKIYQYLTQNSFQKTIDTDLVMKIGAVGEYSITSMYLDNHYFDGKYGVKDEISRNFNRNEYHLTRYSLDTYINSEFSGFVQAKIFESVNKLFFLYQKGMQLDQSALSHQNFQDDNARDFHRFNFEIDEYVNVEEFIDIFRKHKHQKYSSFIKENYLRLLLTRSFLINTVFFQVFTELLIDLFGAPNTDYTSLIKFARTYGMAQQLVNDNCDYLPVGFGFETLCKLPEDTFSDMRRGLITLPLMMFFAGEKTDRGQLFNIYANNSVDCSDTKDNDGQRWLLYQLQESKALGLSQGFVCALATHGERLVNDRMMSDMFSFVRANRYYKAYYDFNYDG